MVNIVLCGGNGTRLWPVSRKLYPKQFCHLIEDRSLFEQTIARNTSLCDRIIIVTNKEQFFLAKNQMESSHADAAYILEPVARNTAPAITLACLGLDCEDVVLVTPSDHAIKNNDAYGKLVKDAEKLACEGYLVTLGVQPEYPETSYGYIEAEGDDVLSFKEKPDLETAKKYLEKGNYFWNSGVFVFKAGIYLEEVEKYSPEILKYSKAAYENALKGSTVEIDIEDMKAIPSDSIDYAVMEKSRKIKVLPANMAWSDLGNLEALYSSYVKDEEGNVKSDKVVCLNSHNNLIISHGRVVGTVDVDGMIIVDTADALFISKKGSSAKVKNLLCDLERVKEDITNVHATVYKPWGDYTVLEQGYCYKIQKIMVKPEKKLSLQKHCRGTGHWTVVNGTAKVTVNDQEITVRAGESFHIARGEPQRLENPGKTDLVIIQVQVEDDLKEDDIPGSDDDF